MPKNVIVEQLNQKPVEEQCVEFVERKGLGHPDFIADSLAENLSLGLCEDYFNRFGRILHHNVDKVLVIGGQSRPTFKGGEVLTPIYIILSGRAVTEVRTQRGIESIPIGPIALKSTKSWLRDNLRFLNVDEHVIVDYRIGRGSADLVGIFEERLEAPRANDTSFGVGFAPLDTLERLVLETERFLNSREAKKKLPEVGEDIKVMGVRHGSRTTLTIAAAMISKLIEDLDHYLSVKEQLRDLALDHLLKLTNMDIEIFVNTADIPEKGLVYLTVTGTSAEHGDDGATGRGNRVNGLITPSRPMSLEAAAGKNPVSHVGKIYNIVARNIAEKAAKLSYVREAYVKLLSQIGRPIDEPQVANVQLVLEQGKELSSNIVNEVEVIVDEELANIMKVTEDVVRKRVSLF